MPVSPPVLGILESMQDLDQRNKSTDDSILR